MTDIPVFAQIEIKVDFLLGTTSLLMAMLIHNRPDLDTLGTLPVQRADELDPRLVAHLAYSDEVNQQFFARVREHAAALNAASGRSETPG